MIYLVEFVKLTFDFYDTPYCTVHISGLASDRSAQSDIYTSVIIRDFWTVTFEHTNLRFPAQASLR